jgi:hypothetical protein
MIFSPGRLRLERDERGNTLLAIHPRGGSLTAPTDHLVNTIVIVRHIASENRLMMRDPVSKLPDYSKIGVGGRSCGWNWGGERCAGEGRPEMGQPNSAILPRRENMLPKGEFQFCDDLPVVG